MKKILVTGAAGFIGFHLSKRLLEDGNTVIGYDNMNDYYETSLKESRLNLLKEYVAFTFVQAGLEDRKAVEGIFEKHQFDVVINLAAQAGVRYSIENPYAYIDSNIMGFINVLEACRHHAIKHLIYASSSSVYGANTKMPFSVKDAVDHPISLYAATKKANELMAHSYAALYNLPCTGLRFFTVYGPFGRPDMAYFKFVKNILNHEPIELNNEGNMKRDFTYIDDIVEGIIRLIDKPPVVGDASDKRSLEPGRSFAPYRIYNIGNNFPVTLLKFVETIEEKLGEKAIKRLMPMQLGDVLETYADIDDLVADTGFRPSISLDVGIERYVKWHKCYYDNT